MFRPENPPIRSRHDAEAIGISTQPTGGSIEPEQAVESGNPGLDVGVSRRIKHQTNYIPAYSHLPRQQRHARETRREHFEWKSFAEVKDEIWGTNLSWIEYKPTQKHSSFLEENDGCQMMNTRRLPDIRDEESIPACQCPTTSLLQCCTCDIAVTSRRCRIWAHGKRTMLSGRHLPLLQGQRPANSSASSICIRQVE